MGRSIEVTNAGVYIEINKTEEEIADYFEQKGMDICEWVEAQEGKLFHQGEMSQKNIFVHDSKYDLSANIISTDIETLRNNFIMEYKIVIENLIDIFGDGNVDVKVGVIEYLDETY